MAKLDTIEGIGPSFVKKLEKKGITTTRTLLARGHNRKGRRELSRETGISEKLILSWVNQADMMQVRGIGPEYADLLENSGVDTSKELAHRKAENLAAKMEEVNQSKNLVRRTPALKQVKAWVNDAKAFHSAAHGLAGDSDTDAPPPPRRYKVEH